MRYFLQQILEIIDAFLAGIVVMIIIFHFAAIESGGTGITPEGKSVAILFSIDDFYCKGVARS